MNLVTQCPRCALLFQVAPEVLAASKGQVRCGQCAHEFEGQAHALTEPWLESATDSPADSLLSSPRIDVEALLRRQDTPSESVPVSPPTATPTPGRVPAPASVQVPSSSPASGLAPASLPRESERTRAPALPLKTDVQTQSPVVSAVRWDVWMLRGMALLLTGGLIVQALVFFRDELAARLPNSRPLLEALCGPAACTLAPLRLGNGIVIDSSSLVRGDAGLTFHVSLRNSLEVPLAMTALELTLTDDQDRVLMRRVLKPHELGAPAELAAGQMWTRALGVEPGKVDTEITGYRLVSFYP